jgi:SEL1 protein
MKYGIMALDYARVQLGLDPDSQIAQEEPVKECEEVDEAGVCLNPEVVVEVEEEAFDADWTKAAHYYRLASQEHKSARANYNLGYMHEWGLGLTQDFPLAKRHYDLSKAGSKQATLAVQIALMTMNLHEQVKQMQAAWKKWNQRAVEDDYDEEDERYHRPPPRNQELTKLDVIVKHVVSWESLLIILLTLVLSRILQYRRT